MNNQGTGLGLSICKHIIEKMGGNVKVESEGKDKGTQFIISLTAISSVKPSNLNIVDDEQVYI